jgi:hypothetical protein
MSLAMTLPAPGIPLSALVRALAAAETLTK